MVLERLPVPLPGQAEVRRWGRAHTCHTSALYQDRLGTLRVEEGIGGWRWLAVGGWWLGHSRWWQAEDCGVGKQGCGVVCGRCRWRLQGCGVMWGV